MPLRTVLWFDSSLSCVFARFLFRCSFVRCRSSRVARSSRVRVRRCASLRFRVRVALTHFLTHSLTHRRPRARCACVLRFCEVDPSFPFVAPSLPRSLDVDRVGGQVRALTFLPLRSPPLRSLPSALAARRLSCDEGKSFPPHP